VGADYGPAGRLRIAPARLLAGCYLDLGHRIEDTTLVVGTGRSGSTWLAELLNHDNAYRIVFEPFRSDRVRRARGFRRGHYLDPQEQDHPLAPAADALLAGRVRSWWTDRQNRRRLATRRIVKEVRLTNLLPWIRARHPRLRIVYVVRDPLAVARSWLELGWGDDLDDLLGQPALLERLGVDAERLAALGAEGSPVERHVLRWCLENTLPLRLLPELDLHLVVYERLRAEPADEVERLFAYVGRDPGGALAAAARPSATAGFRRTSSVEIGAEDRRRAEATLAAFGLEHALSGRTA
jgi:sulfotransferase family protein